MAQRFFFFFPNIRPVMVVVVSVAAAVAARGDVSTAAITTEVPFDVFATSFEDPSGIAVQSDGSVFVVDRHAGTLTQITAGGERQVVLSNLEEPRGVAVGLGGVFVLEPARLLRLDADGVVSVVSASVAQARALTADPDGRIWIAVRPPGSAADEVMRLEPSGTLTPIASGFIDVRGIAADHTALYVALSSLSGAISDRTTLARLPLHPDGTAGPVESLQRDSPPQPNGLAIDAAGDVFVTGWGPADNAGAPGIVIKQRGEGEVALVASGLIQPGAAAFGPGRDLFVLERSFPGRVLRFRPPPPPLISAPMFTNQTQIRITGAADANSLVQIVRLTSGAALLGATVADPATGTFAVTAPVTENAETRFSVTATANAGNGLVGLPAIAAVVHDDHRPSVDILEPPDATHVATELAVRARASDEDSGMETLRLMIDQLMQSGVTAASNGGPLTATAIIDTAALREGPHTLTAVASDRAGNWGTASRLVVVDRTPPDTVILTGPPDEAATDSVSFTFEGSDEQSTDFDFAWRIDEGPWSVFSETPTAQLTSLAAGAHRFEVVARDRAGNVDATPAVQAFTVIALRVRIVEPVAGSAIATQTAWVRGTIDSALDVSVTLPLPDVYRQALGLESLAAPNEAGTFAAEVPVVPGMTSLAIVVRDGAGRIATDTVAITVQEPMFPALRLEAFPPAGLAPHAVRFRANGLPEAGIYSLDLESDGISDYTGNAFPDQQFVYARPGIHLATLRITTSDGRMLVARGAIEVYDRAGLEARLQAVWAGFKGALRAGDVAGAVSFLHRDRRAAWTEYFGRLTPAQFATTDTTFTDIVLLEVAPGRAECEMMRDVGGLLYSFPVSFEIDVDGGWKLWQF